MFKWIRKTLLFAVGFTLPIQAFSMLNLGAFGLTPFKATTAVLLGFVAVQFAVGSRRIGGDSKLIWIVAFGVSVGISAVQGFVSGIPGSVLIVLSVTYYSLLLYYVLIGYAITREDDLNAVLYGLAWGGLVTALPAVLGLERAEGMDGRMSGLSGQANTFGIDMGVVVAVALALFAATRSLLTRALLAGAAAAAVGGMLLSLSRTAFASGAAMWGFWVFRSGRTDTVKYVIPAVAILVGVLLLAPATVSDRIATVTDSRKQAVQGPLRARLDQYEFAFKAFASSPLVGVGKLNFISWARQQPGGKVIRHHVHNAYLSILATQGLVGLIPYMMILVLSWKQYTQAWQAARVHRASRDAELARLGTYALFLQIALLGSAVAGLAGMMHTSKAAWLLMALSPVVRNLAFQRINLIKAASPAPEIERDDLSPAAA